MLKAPQLMAPGICCFLLVGYVSAATISWNGGDGLWSNPAQWSCATCPGPVYPNNGGPGQLYDVVIQPLLAGTVTLDTSPTVQSVVLGSGDELNLPAATALTLNNDLTSAGSLQLSDGAAMIVNGQSYINSGFASLQSGSTLTLSSNLVAGGATSLHLSDPNTNLTVGGSFTNGDGTAISLVQLLNRSAMNVTGAFSQTGYLNADGDSLFQTGQFTQDATSHVSLSNGAGGTVMGSFYNNGGNINLQSGATLLITGALTATGLGGINLTDPNTVLSVGGNLTSGNSQGVPVVELTNSSSLLVSGVFSQTGNLVLDGIGTNAVLGGFTQDATSGLHLSNIANVTVNGAVNNNGGVLNLQSGSVLMVNGNLTGSGASRVYMTDPNTLISVSGSMSSGDSTASGTVQLTYASALNVAGTFTQTGLVSLDGSGASLTAGAFIQDSASNLLLSNTATATVNGNLTNAGVIDLQHSSLTIGGSMIGSGSAVLSLTDHSGASVAGNLINGDGMGSAGVHLDNVSSLTVAGQIEQIGSSLSVDGVGSTLGAAGFIQDGASSLSVTGLANADITGGVVNSGLVYVGNNGFLEVDGGFMNSGVGSIQVDQSNATLVAAGGLTLAPGSTLSTGGHVILDGFGLSGSDSGITADDTYGYMQAADGLLTIELAGDDMYSSITVDGTVSLNGTLDVVLEDGFAPGAGSVFNFMTFQGGAPANNSNFSNFVFPVWDGLTFQEELTSGGIGLEVVPADPPAPEASSAVLVFLGVVLTVVVKVWQRSMGKH